MCKPPHGYMSHRLPKITTEYAVQHDVVLSDGEMTVTHACKSLQDADDLVELSSWRNMRIVARVVTEWVEIPDEEVDG